MSSQRTLVFAFLSISLGAAAATAVHADDSMMKKDEMKKSDIMKKDDASGAVGAMKDDAMKKDGMSKDTTN